MEIENLMTKMVMVGLLLLTGLVCNSCSDDDDAASHMYQYIATGRISGGSLSDLNVLTDYTTAIEGVMGNSYKEKDGEIIKACDAVYARHQSQSTKAKGSVTIMKYRLTSDDSDTGKQLKTYQYN